MRGLPRSPRRINGVRLFSILIPLALIGYFWWQSQPKSYRLIATSDTAAVTLIPCQDGYLTQEKSGWVLRDWESGKERWQVGLQKTDLSPNAHPAWSIGRRGDVFVMFLPASSGPLLQIWKNGRLTFKTTLSTWKGNQNVRDRVLNDGRVIAWTEQPPRCPAVVVEDEKIIAHGTLPYREGHRTFVAPDGSFAVVNDASDIIYTPITIADGSLTATEIPLKGVNVSVEKYPPYYEEGDLLVAGQGLTESGVIFEGKGPKSSGGWETDTVTPGGVYLLQTKGPRSRVYAPSTGEQWSYYAGEDNRGGDATMDGRYALSYFTPDFSPQAARLLQWLIQIPGVGDALPDPYTGHAGLYERPGRLRALLRIDLERWWPSHDVGSYWWFPSPDGRAIVVNLESYDGGARCLLFRW
ncbi:MAG: hypothetical protein BWY76_00172 [bacterium ADurb.Bin429]|nr:MAG: hypothetical protein BWY76_00172 [bacterium ADurb.Bin429]